MAHGALYQERFFRSLQCGYRPPRCLGLLPMTAAAGVFPQGLVGKNLVVAHPLQRIIPGISVLVTSSLIDTRCAEQYTSAKAGYTIPGEARIKAYAQCVAAFMQRYLIKVIYNQWPESNNSMRCAFLHGCASVKQRNCPGYATQK